MLFEWTRMKIKLSHVYDCGGTYWYFFDALRRDTWCKGKPLLLCICKTRRDSHVMTQANSERFDRFGYTRLMGLISEKP